MTHRTATRVRWWLWPALWVLLAPPWATAQSACTSDDQPAPTGLMERFINADCADCWTDAQTPRPAPRTLALDWIAPGSQGDDAPLSTAARRDSLYRLQALGRALPPQSDATTHAVQSGRYRVRVGHGLPINNYVGASVQVLPGKAKRQPDGGWTTWLVLVETVPAGTEGSPVERNLVRNSFQASWNGPEMLSKGEQKPAPDIRPMQIPEGSNPERLRVVGWLEDGQGRVHALAQSACTGR